MQEGTFFIIKTDKGFLKPYEDYSYHFTDQINEAHRYKNFSGATYTIKELAIRDHKVSLVQINATYEEADTKDAGLDQLYAPQLEAYRKLLARVTIDIESLSRKDWTRFVNLNSTLSSLGLIKLWKQ